MILFRTRRDSKSMLLLGMAALLAANILNLLLRFTQGTVEHLASGAMGLFYGLSIPLLLLSIRQKVRQRDGSGRSCL